MKIKLVHAAGFAAAVLPQTISGQNGHKPNVIIIYADDLGYGDVSCNGSATIKTTNLDKAAKQGLRFTNAHCTSASSTPSRYSLLTGEYAWRKKGTGVATGDAVAIIKPDRYTIADVFKNAGYTTGVVGKWHLGLGTESGADWNGEIMSGPLDLGFDYNFIMPATGDRVPCVFIENRRIVNLDPADPIKVSFTDPILTEPTGKDHPELLKLHPSRGHDMTIVNGISRIGYMSGGKSARWVDEDLADVITGKAVSFIEKNRDKPFFLYFSTHDIHVPRVPNQRFVGKSGMGSRGDAILEFDWSVGQILDKIDQLRLTKNTMIIITSDNGPVVDDGYKDQSAELLGNHKPAGPLRGGKYSAFDGGTRVAFVVTWPGKIKPGISDAMISQVDFMSSFAELTGQKLPDGAGPDSYNYLNVLLGKSKTGREWIVEHNNQSHLGIIRGDWKYIEPNAGNRLHGSGSENGNDPMPQLYNITSDIGEKVNVAETQPVILKELQELLQEIRDGKHSRN
jgi:arylsulfatase A-like enzyme